MVLIHNGGREQAIVDHAASLLRPGGRVLLYDLDSTMIRIELPAAPVTQLHDRFVDYLRSRGNDPSVGLRLPQLLESAGIASTADLERWAREIETLDAQPHQPWMISCGFVGVGRLDPH